MTMKKPSEPNFLTHTHKDHAFQVYKKFIPVFVFFADKKSTPDCSPVNSPTLLKSNGCKSSNSTPDGLAPIAKTEEMSDDLSEETLVNEKNSQNHSTPKKSSWRLSNGSTSQLVKNSSDDPPWWSDEDDDERTDRNASTLTNGNSSGKNHSHSVEDGFESFSCTDEEDEGDQTSLDSTSTSR